MTSIRAEQPAPEYVPGHDLLAGKACEGCSMYTTAARKNADALKPSTPLPFRLIVEPSINR